MAGRWQAIISLVFVILSCVHQGCHSAPVLQGATYSSAYSLIRFTRSHVLQLLTRYREQQMDNKNFEEKDLILPSLPVLSTDLDTWLNLEEWERLHAASVALNTYWLSLERKRRQMEKEEETQRLSQSTTSLPMNIASIQLNLRDLMRQVNSQLKLVNETASLTLPPSGEALQGEPSQNESPPKTQWDSRREGYVVLRDLSLYLTKLARDFLILDSKQKKAHSSSPHGKF